MLFQRFFETISDLLPDRLLLGNPEALSKLNPNKIYPENVRSILGVSSTSAKRICDTAVRQGVFRKYVEVLSPEGEAAATAEREESLPDTVHFWTERNGNYEEVYLPTRDLPKVIFYRLSDEADTRQPHSSPA